MDSTAAETLRAAAEVFVPGPPHDPTPGAAQVEADRFIEHYLDSLVPGSATGVTGLLDELAAHFGGARFAALSIDERGVVLDRLAEHDVPALREIPTLLGMLTVAAVYGEWTGLDAAGSLVREPLGWSMTGFAGPSRGRPGLLRAP